MSKIGDRIAAVQLRSETNYATREELVRVNSIIRYMTGVAAKCFGLDVVCHVWFGVPLRRTAGVKISRQHDMPARTEDNVLVKRSFFPAKYGDGRCLTCGRRGCIFEGSPITKWRRGSLEGWSRYECWVVAVSFLTSAEFVRIQIAMESDGWAPRIDLGPLFVEADAAVPPELVADFDTVRKLFSSIGIGEMQARKIMSGIIMKDDEDAASRD